MEYSDDLDEINNQTALTLLPVIIVICVYMIIGLIGNPLVAIYYGYYVKPSPSYHFIVAMAIFDIMICCVSMPLEIVDMRFPYEFPSKEACKILRFVNYFASISSGVVLVAIASDRYRKVCQPFKTQITMKMSKIIIGVVSLFALCVSWPALVLYDLHAVSNITSIPGLTGYDCTFTRKNEFKMYILIYNSVLFLVFLGCILTLSVLYVLIGRKLCRLNRFRFSACGRKSSHSTCTPPTSSSEVEFKANRIRLEPMIVQNSVVPNSKLTDLTTEACLPDVSHDQSRKQSNDSREHKILLNKEIDIHHYVNMPTESGIANTTLKTASMSGDIQTERKPSKPMLQTRVSSRTCMMKRKSKQRERYIHLRKYTILMLCISLAFVVGFLPYLGLITWRTLAKNYERELLSNSELVAYNICLRSWLISSVVNPLIYGCFTSDFRSYVYSLFKWCFCHCCKKKERQFLARKISQDSDSVP